MSSDGNTNRPLPSLILLGIFDFVCVLNAGELYKDKKFVAGTWWLLAGVVFSVVGYYWQQIKRKLGAWLLASGHRLQGTSETAATEDKAPVDKTTVDGILAGLPKQAPSTGNGLGRDWRDGFINPQFEIVDDHKFENEEIVVDNKSFRRCSFKNVKLLFHGHAPFEFVEGTTLDAGTVIFGTDDPAILAYNLIQRKFASVPGAKIQYGALDSKGKDVALTPLAVEPVEKPREPSKLVIHSANYAAWSGQGKSYDVTKYLRSIITGDSLVLDRIENHSFAVEGKNLVPEDPLFGKPKKLEVTYSYDGESPKTIRRTEGDRLTLPEDSAMAWLGKQLNSAKAEIDKIKATQLPLSPLQIEAMQLSSELLAFLKQMGPAPAPKYTRAEINDMNSAQMKVLMDARDGDFFEACEYHFGDKYYFGQQTAQGLESQLTAGATRMFTRYRKLEAAYALGLKGKVEGLRNRLVVEGIEADALIAPIPYKDSEQHIRSIAAKLWELAFKVGEKGHA
jgi:hypothetical protein